MIFLKCWIHLFWFNYIYNAVFIIKIRINVIKEDVFNLGTILNNLCIIFWRFSEKKKRQFEKK